MINIQTEIHSNIATLTLQGRLTVQSSQQLSNTIDGLSENITSIDINLEEVEYISSAGLRVFVAVDKLIARRNGTFRILYPNEDVYEVLEMTGLVDVLTIVR